MNLLNYSLTALLCYLGLFVGFILAIIAKEELKAGKKYFIFTQNVILLLIFIFLFLFINLNYVSVLLVLVFIITYTIKNIKEPVKQQYIYIILSVIFYISSRKIDLFIIQSSLIFLYGLPAGTLLSYKSKKEAMFNILRNVVFIIITITLFLVFH